MGMFCRSKSVYSRKKGLRKLMKIEIDARNKRRIWEGEKKVFWVGFFCRSNWKRNYEFIVGQIQRPWNSLHVGIGVWVGVSPINIEELVMMGVARSKEFEGIAGKSKWICNIVWIDKKVSNNWEKEQRDGWLMTLEKKQNQSKRNGLLWS